ncbi:MAG: hypothetical protein QF757_01985 [Candidatus Marinimicrobia bacterium]|nr:hypothetical protein [Candidatus Neomarinimicrobiota bacterium]
MKRRVTLLTLLLLWLNAGCDFQDVSEFEIPTWNVTLTIPLMHEWYPLSNIVDDSVIQSSGDSIFIEFGGELPKDSINADYLQIPLEMSVGFADTTVGPSAGDIFSGYTLTLTDTIPIGETMESMSVINWANPPATVQFPSASIQKIDGQSWNLVADAIELTLGQTELDTTLFDSEELFAEIPFISEIIGIFIGGDAGDNYYQSVFENIDLPVDIDSTWALLLSGVDTLADHETNTLAITESIDSTTSLVDQALGEAIGFNFGFTLQRVADDDTLTIPAGDELDMLMGISMGIQDLDYARVVVTEASLMDPDDMEPISFDQASIEAEDCAVSGVYGGSFAEGTSNVPKVNIIGVSDVFSTFPFGINFGIEFENFVDPDDSSLSFEHTLDAVPWEDEEKLDGWAFINPDNPDPQNPTIPLDSLMIIPTVTTAAGTVDVDLDGSEWIFSLGVDVYPLEFGSLMADLDCAFPPQTQEIDDIPQGFTGMSFGEVILEFTMYNQIRLPLSLNLDLIGVGNTGDSVQVVVDADLGIPAVVGDTAKTILRLSSIGTVVQIYDSINDSLPSSADTISALEGETNTIVDLMALNPSQMIVDATAGIEGLGSLDQNAAFWGEYNLIAPFSVIMDTITFVPVTSTPVTEMDHETRNQFRASVKGASMTTRIINGLPISGEMAIIFSDRDLFPLDRKAETLQTIADSLQWSDSLYIVASCSTLKPSNDDMYIFNVMNDSSDCIEGVAYLIRGVPASRDTVYSFVDTLLKIVLPTPDEYYGQGDPGGSPGMVKTPGDTVVVSEIDSNKITMLSSLGDHYINNMTRFYGTEGEAVFFSTRDTLEILSYISFTLQSTGMLEEAQDELVITYPNGNESLVQDSTIVIRWRSLGDEVSGQNVELFISDLEEPDIAQDEDWESISGGAISNADSMIWTPGASDVDDILWLKICNEDGSLCDQSGWHFEITSSGGRMVSPPPRKFDEISPAVNKNPISGNR